MVKLGYLKFPGTLAFRRIVAWVIWTWNFPFKASDFFDQHIVFTLWKKYSAAQWLAVVRLWEIYHIHFFTNAQYLDHQAYTFFWSLSWCLKRNSPLHLQMYGWTTCSISVLKSCILLSRTLLLSLKIYIFLKASELICSKEYIFVAEEIYLAYRTCCSIEIRQSKCLFLLTWSCFC